MAEGMNPLEEATIQEVLEANVLLNYLEQDHIDAEVSIEDILLVHSMVDEAEWKQLVVDAADKLGVDLPYGQDRT